MVNYVDKNGCFGRKERITTWQTNEMSRALSCLFPFFFLLLSMALLYHMPSHLQVTYSHIGLFFWFQFVCSDPRTRGVYRYLKTLQLVIQLRLLEDPAT